MINNETTLTIKGDDLDEVPHLISLRFIDNKTRKTIIYDIRNGDLSNVLENGVELNIRGQKVEFEGSKIHAPYPEMYEDLTPHRCNLSGANTNSILASKIAIAIKDENDLSEILSHFTSLSEYSFYKELMELKRLKEELEVEIAAVEDEIKQVMGDEETLFAGAFKVSWKTFTSSRLDSTALKKALPQIAAQFTKQTTARRFSIN